MSEDRRSRLLGGGFGIGAALGMMVGLLLGPKCVKIIITGQGSVGCSHAEKLCDPTSHGEDKQDDRCKKQ